MYPSTQQQVPHRVGQLELEQWQPVGSEDPQEHLHALLDLLDSAEAFIHSPAGTSVTYG
jgi:hypothetical protein